MQNIVSIPRKLALTTAGIVFVAIGVLIAVIPARAGNQESFATINGPATVWDGWLCTWTATTNISNPQYEWKVSTPETTIIGTNPYVSYAFDKASGGPHQGLHLRVYNLAGAQAVDDKLIGVYFDGVGNPDCP